MKLPRIPEKVEQQHGITLLRSIGADVRVLGTRRSRGKKCPKCGTFVPEDQATRQTPGIADVFAVLPPLPKEQMWRAMWWEAKATDGRMSQEQEDFRVSCLAANLWHVVGPFDALLEALAERGYVNRGSLAHYRKAAGAKPAQEKANQGSLPNTTNKAGTVPPSGEALSGTGLSAALDLPSAGCTCQWAPGGVWALNANCPVHGAK